MQLGVSFRKSTLDNHVDKTMMVEADKDLSWGLISWSPYLSEARAHMLSKIWTGVDNYIFLGTCTDMRACWQEKALHWRDLLSAMVVTNAPEPLSRVPSNFFVAAQCCVSPPSGNRFPSTPMVGLSLWASTPFSILRSAFGNILLKQDYVVDPSRSPLRDLFDFVSGVRPLKLNDSVCCSTLQFDAMYTSITWENNGGGVLLMGGMDPALPAGSPK